MRSRLARSALSALVVSLVACGGKVAAGGSTDGGSTVATCAGADLESDPTNCGWCGHDCRGATCSNRVCAPQAISSGEESPASLALDDDTVFWTSEPGAHVRRATKDGRAPADLAASPSPHGVHVHGSDAYWVSGDTVLHAAKTGGPPSPIGPPNVLQIAICEGALWSSGAAGELSGTTLAGSPAASTTLEGVAYALACDADGALDLAFVDHGPRGAEDPARGRVQRLTGKGMTVLATEVRLPQQLTVDADAVYFTSGRFTGLIQSVPRAGGSVATLADGQLDPQGIAVDESFVYWVTVGQLPAEGTVMRVPKHGGAPQYLAFGQRRPYAIAVDAGYVYWTAQGDAGKGNGGVYRVPK